MVEAALKNLSSGGRLLRLMIGGLLLPFSLGWLALLIGLEVSPVWRLSVILPLWGSMLGFFQARAWTCVFLAARGLRETERGTEAVSDLQEAQQLERQAHRVQLQALAMAVGGALLTLLIPS